MLFNYTYGVCTDSLLSHFQKKKKKKNFGVPHGKELSSESRILSYP